MNIGDVLLLNSAELQDRIKRLENDLDDSQEKLIEILKSEENSPELLKLKSLQRQIQQVNSEIDDCVENSSIQQNLIRSIDLQSSSELNDDDDTTSDKLEMDLSAIEKRVAQYEPVVMLKTLIDNLEEVCLNPASCVRAAELLADLRRSGDDVPLPTQELQDALRAQMLHFREQLLHVCSDLFNTALCWSSSTCLRIDLGRALAFRRCCRALSLSNQLDHRILAFCDTILERFLRPIIVEKRSIQIIEDASITLTEAEGGSAIDIVSVVEEVVLQVIDIFKKLLVGEEALCVVLTQISNHLILRLVNLLVEHYLQPLVPSELSSLDSFKREQVDTVRQLQQRLLTATEQTTTNYECPVDAFLDSLKGEVLKRKRNAALLLGRNLTCRPLEPLTSSPDREKYLQISSSIAELANLLKQTWTEAADVSESDEKQRLLLTMRDMVEMHADIVWQAHRQTIESDPKMVAIFFNNCMLLSKITLELSPQNGISLVDLSPRFAQLGTRVLKEHLKRQQREIEALVKPFGCFNGVSKMKDETAEMLGKCLALCCSLNNAWSSLFERSFRLQVVSELVIYLLESLLQALLASEDISADDSACLNELLRSEIAEPLKSLYVQYDKQSEIYRFCDSAYSRFTELVALLNNTMSEIEDRWADGHGPLAAHFKPAEVHSLVRALFQNTHNRAALISKIK